MTNNKSGGIDTLQHVNSHSVEIAHLPVPVAAKLHDAISFDKTLDDVREKVTNVTVGHEQLLS